VGCEIEEVVCRLSRAAEIKRRARPTSARAMPRRQSGGDGILEQ
jgi:hypothetical protein